MPTTEPETQHIAAVVERVRSGFDSVAVAYSTQEGLTFLSASADTLDQLDSVTRKLKISVLDSSFNPPTLAHLQLATFHNEQEIFDATILLLSVTNADKVLDTSQGDADYIQRIVMICTMAREIAERRNPVAVLIANEPIFVCKNEKLKEFFQIQQRSARREVELAWLVGYDTLERIFASRYYDGGVDGMLNSLRTFLSPVGGAARLVCASRPASQPLARQQQLPGLQEHLDNHRVVLVDLGEGAAGISSSDVRSLKRNNDERWKKMVLSGVASFMENENLYSP